MQKERFLSFFYTDLNLKDYPFKESKIEFPKCANCLLFVAVRGLYFLNIIFSFLCILLIINASNNKFYVCRRYNKVKSNHKEAEQPNKSI